MKSLLRTFVLISTIFMIVVNILANALPFNNKTTGEISNQFEVFFVPAGYVFTIWGFIYIVMLIYSIYQVLPRTRVIALLDRIALWVMMTNIANALWLVLWHYEYFLQSVLVMFALLISLVMIYLKVSETRENETFSAEQHAEIYWRVQFPFSVYLGWISVATIANVTLALAVWGWSGFGIAELTWAIVMVAVAALLGLAMIALRRDFAYAAVIIWALVGIGVRFQSTEISYALFAYGSSALLLLAGLIRAFTLPNKK
jgi:hypothetical protein